MAKAKRFPLVANPWKLTRSECAVMKGLCSDLAQKEVADKLFLQLRTIGAYLSRSKRKMKTRTTVRALILFDRLMEQQAKAAADSLQ